MSLVLHDWDLDDNCYRVRLLASLLRLRLERVPVDVHPRRAHRSEAYLRLDPRGRLPILVDGDLVLGDTGAILAHLARSRDAEHRWLPEDPPLFAGVLDWLGFCSTDLAAASRARLHAMLEAEGDGPALVGAARAAFRIMDDVMTRRAFDGLDWFVGAGPTVADVALFPAIALSRDFGLDHDEFPALRRWMRRFRHLPGFVTMPGIPDYH